MINNYIQMINLFKYACSSLLIILIYSCREPFDYDLPASSIDALVVEGVVTDGPGPYDIKLSQAIPFNSDKQVIVKKAGVYVMDDLNNRFDFKEKNPGQYLSDSATFRGQLGRTYTLFIKTSDGLEYKSSPCLIEPESKIDSVYNFVNRDNYPYSFQIYMDLSFGSDQKMSTKLDAALSVENILDEWHFVYGPKYIITIDPNDSTKITRTLVPGEGARIDSSEVLVTYYTTSTLNFRPILKTNTDYVAGSKIIKIPVGAFQITEGSDSLNDSTSLSYGGNYILTVYASTISNVTFNYYYNLTSQISGNNTFFDPMPVNLVGNIKCTSDSTKAAYGLFQANSVVKKYVTITSSGTIRPTNGIPPLTRQTIFNSDTTGNSTGVK
jgi:hypothetical protein